MGRLSRDRTGPGDSQPLPIIPYVIELHFNQLPDESDRRFFNTVPTSLQLPSKTVDRLRQLAARQLAETENLNDWCLTFGTSQSNRIHQPTLRCRRARCKTNGKSMNTTLMKNRPETKQSLLARYDCGPVKLSGDSNAFYERHVTFDQVVAETETTDRDKFEAIARSVRDMLSQRWLKTEQTYRQRNAKRVYYLSMEFLLGRALANNISNLLLDPEAQQFAKQHQLDPLQIIEQEPDAGLGNGGLGRLAACFLDSMATLGIAGMGYGLRYDYGIFRQSIRDGWQAEQPDHWLARPDPWEVARPNEAVEVKLNVSFEIRDGALRVVAWSSVIADRHSV